MEDHVNGDTHALDSTAEDKHEVSVEGHSNVNVSATCFINMYTEQNCKGDLKVSGVTSCDAGSCDKLTHVNDNWVKSVRNGARDKYVCTKSAVLDVHGWADILEVPPYQCFNLEHALAEDDLKLTWKTR